MSPDDPSDEDFFSDNTAFMLRRTQEASFAAYAARADRRGLRPGHYAVLQLIDVHPGISQMELSRRVGRDKTTLTRLLQDFEARGFIRRDVDPQDRRGRLLSLLPPGREHLLELQACARAHDAALAEIVGPDKDKLLDILRRIIVGLDKSA